MNAFTSIGGGGGDNGAEQHQRQERRHQPRRERQQCERAIKSTILYIDIANHTDHSAVRANKHDSSVHSSARETMH